MALAVDDLHVLPCDLVLLALAVIQKVQCVHLLLHGRFFEKLGLQIEQRHAVKLGQHRRCDYRRWLQPDAQTGLQGKKLKDEYRAQKSGTAQLARADVVDAVLRHRARHGIPDRHTAGNGKAQLPQQHRRAVQRQMAHSKRLRRPDQNAPQLIGRLRRQDDPNAAICAGRPVQQRAEMG